MDLSQWWSLKRHRKLELAERPQWQIVGVTADEADAFASDGSAASKRVTEMVAQKVRAVRNLDIPESAELAAMDSAAKLAWFRRHVPVQDVVALGQAIMGALDPEEE
jgi:hypothetical protein